MECMSKACTIAVVSSLMVQEEQNVLWNDVSEQWCLGVGCSWIYAQQHKRSEGFTERSLSEGKGVSVSTSSVFRRLSLEIPGRSMHPSCRKCWIS